MSILYYTPAEPPKTPFAVGDTVHVMSREMKPLGTQTIVKVGPVRVVTDCGRTWRTNTGEWYNHREHRSWPFPSIRKVEANA
jgi:hypothetical protein